jgi:hypothetical protein
MHPPTVPAESQQQTKPLRYDVRVVNIEVPVRVFNGDTFVDTLTLKDFELSEDGVPQRIEALYLVRNAAIDRKEETNVFSPDTSRYFYLFFICYEYTPKIRDAVNYFIEKVLRPNDRLVVVTPRMAYDMKKEIAAAVPRGKIAEKLLGIVRKDILAGDAACRCALNDLKRMVRSKNDVESPLGVDYEGGYGETGDGGMDNFLMKYRADLEKKILVGMENNIRLKFMVSELYVPFANMAEAAGGLTTSSSNASYMMEKASKASENYYLLYYSPQSRAEDGKFREIKVRVKGGGFRVSHRAGYFAK